MPAVVPLPSWAPEESAAELYEHAPCGYVSTAADGTVVRLNETLLGWLGYARGEVVGRRRFADLVAPGPRVVWLTHHVPRLAAAGEVGGVLLDLVRSDGTVLPVLVGARLVPASDRAPALVRLTVFDARERRAYETSLVAARAAAERAARRANALQEVTRACALSHGSDELGAAVVAATAGAYQGSGCALWLPDAAEQLVVAASCGAVPDVPLDRVGRRGREAVSAAWETATVVLDDATPEVAQGARWAGTSRVAFVPVLHAGQPLGVLVLLLGPASDVGSDEVPALAAIGELVGMALARTRLYEQLHRRALHDELTGLANRVLLAEFLGQALARARRTGEPLAVLLIDLDGFKQVNDTLGHAAGDALLKVCAARLRDEVREADQLARLGGDEFVLVSEATDEAAAAATAARIAARLSEPVVVGDRTVAVGASVGVAVRTAGEVQVDGEALLARADAAMYDVKRSNRSRR